VGYPAPGLPTFGSEGTTGPGPGAFEECGRSVDVRPNRPQRRTRQCRARPRVNQRPGNTPANPEGLDALRRRFESAWESALLHGAPPQVEEFLDGISAPAR